MTVSFPSDAFDGANPVVRRKPARDHARLIAIAITIAIHAVILAMALTAVQVARPRVMQELSVQIAPQKIEPVKDIAPPPRLMVPAPITAPLPDVVLQSATPPPVVAQPPAAKPMPPASRAAPQTASGEGRDAFFARLLARLNRYKQYPHAARQARIQGVVQLHFVMDAQGKVLSFEIARSSGRPVLDAEALALIQRAQPLPLLPADFPTPTLDAIVPIEFSLSG